MKHLTNAAICLVFTLRHKIAPLHKMEGLFGYLHNETVKLKVTQVQSEFDTINSCSANTIAI